MQTALYYPFTGPEREPFLKSALFLWDSVDFIVPYREFRPRGNSSDENAALDIIARTYVPTDADKQQAHEELEEICTGPLSARFAFELDRPDPPYDFYPQKLLPKTWKMLAHSRLARIMSGTDGVTRAATGPLFGYYMMTILAICCSQGRKRLITDQTDPYRALSTLLADEAPNAPPSDDWHGRLIALTLSGPDFQETSLKRLVDLRSREDKLLSDLRRQFLRAVDEAAADISANASNPNIVSERIAEFTDTMEKDLAELKRALNRSAASLILSKEFGVSVLAATAAVSVEPISGSLLAVGALTKSLMDYQDRRRKLLREHPSSWLLAASGPRFPIA